MFYAVQTPCSALFHDPLQHQICAIPTRFDILDEMVFRSITTLLTFLQMSIRLFAVLEVRDYFAAFLNDFFHACLTRERHSALAATYAPCS